MKYTDAGCLVHVHPCPHQVTDAEGNQVYILSFSLSEFVTLLLKLSCLNEEADEGGQILLHKSYDECVHLRGHHTGVSVSLDETGDALRISHAFGEELRLE